MGPLIPVAFGLVVLLACFLAWLFLRIRDKRTGSNSTSNLRRVIVAAVAAIAIPFTALYAIGVIQGFIPSRVFAGEFGFSPPTDVTELQGHSFSLFDSGEAYLRFRASQSTIDRIVASKFVPIDEKTFGIGLASDGEPPAFWKPFQTHPTQFYRSYSLDHDFAWCCALLCYDQNSGVAYFSYCGVD